MESNVKKIFLKLAMGLWIVSTAGLSAESTRPANIPQEWPEECVPVECKKSNVKQCQNGQSPCHKINQQWDGRPFYKDTNIWIVTPRFGKTYGMEDEYIDTELSGIEAASYRIENSWLECGFGGREEQCLQHTQGVLEIYVDESKTSLPWIHPEQMADWHDSYSSAWVLQTKKPRDDYPYDDKVIVNKLTKPGYRLRPFADPQTKHEAAYFQDLGDINDWQAMVAGILGYKRHAIDGLTVISFFYQVNEDGQNRNKPRTFRLQSDFTRIYGSKTKDVKEFHTFYLPARYIQQIVQTDKVAKEKNNAFFKQMFEQMKKK